MSRSIPGYIRDAPIFDDKIRYEWDDMRTDEYFDREDLELAERLANVSDRANIAFTIAIGEWIVHRFDVVSDDQTPRLYMEALWAGSIDWRYLSGATFSNEEWEGPVRRPLSLAMLIGGEAIVDALEQNPVYHEVGSMTQLANHVLPAGSGFAEWHEKVVQRLERLFPSTYDPDDLFREGNELGPPVPREVFDIDTDYDSATGESLTTAFLSDITPDNNEFLLTVEQMQVNGFEGAPYP